MQRFESTTDPSGKRELERLYDDVVSSGLGVEGRPIDRFASRAARPDILASTWALAKGGPVAGQPLVSPR